MNSRLSEVYNKRAAEVTMLPGGWYGVPLNKYEGGESVIVAPVRSKPVQKIKTDMGYVPTDRDIASMYRYVVNRHYTKPLETASTFSGVLGADKLNSQYTRIKNSYLPDINFDIIGSEKYPEPPVFWKTTIGQNSRLFDRPDGNVYK